MRFLRTANAGGLITLDGVRILMDGVCEAVAPYLQTPPELREYLQEKVPDAVGFTHLHPDHFHSGYLDFCTQAGTVILLPGAEKISVKGIRIAPLETRHLGKTDPSLQHNSFLIQGSQTVLFTGDASPVELAGITGVDVLIAPYAYVSTSAGIKAAAATGAKHLVLVHMPGTDPDLYGIWDSVRTGLSRCTHFSVTVPEMGEDLQIDENRRLP